MVKLLQFWIILPLQMAFISSQLSRSDSTAQAFHYVTEEDFTEVPVARQLHDADYVSLTSMPILLILALVGNCFTVIIMQKKDFKVMTFSIILTALALSDTALSIMVPFNKKFVISAFQNDARAISPIGCKAFFWFWRTSKMTSSWFVVLVSIDRFVAVWFPLKAKIINSRKKVMINITAVCAVIGGFNAFWGHTCDVLKNGSCIPNIAEVGKETLARGMVFAGTFLYSIIPGCLIVIFNSMTIARIVKKHWERRRLTQNLPQSNSQMRQMTTMLMGVSLAFIILVIPISIVHCISLVWGKNIFQTDDPIISTLRDITQIMEQTNYSINFFLYVFCSSTYRDEFLKMITLNHYSTKPKATNVGQRKTTQNQLPKPEAKPVAQENHPVNEIVEVNVI